ncbi:hypothetical protein L0657_27170 [Dyadobacter sp. CY345]|uniref:hypothetical protein n=1 Tax=Dyadobacter sp. CY345 TaxID=2909335 RepID=UPI001F328634|nr:hypothetical protein [Dyadobacter sp. CY345]MCF2447666.1 hypothetical protein [Dyadobacter sp. CY345]
MDNTFELDVNFNGQTFEFQGELIVSGYLHKIQLDVNGTIVSFEPDEERNYRALMSIEDLKENDIPVDLLRAIALRLDSLLG